MAHSHAIVWMDSREAHVFQFNREDVEGQRIRAHQPARRVHHKAGSIGAGHAQLDHQYFDEIVQALDGVQEWLLCGPAEGKDRLHTDLKARHPDLEKKLLAVEPSDHPTDGQLLDHARRFFKAADRMRPNSPPPPGRA